MSGARESDIRTGRFIVGIVLVFAGGELFLRSAGLEHVAGWDAALFSIEGIRVTTGVLLAGIAFGLLLIYVDPQSSLSWIVMTAFLVTLVIGVAIALESRLWRMSLLELMASIALVVSGTWFFLSSVRFTPID